MASTGQQQDSVAYDVIIHPFFGPDKVSQCLAVNSAMPRGEYKFDLSCFVSFYEATLQHKWKTRQT